MDKFRKANITGGSLGAGLNGNGSNGGEELALSFDHLQKSGSDVGLYTKRKESLPGQASLDANDEHLMNDILASI